MALVSRVIGYRERIVYLSLAAGCLAACGGVEVVSADGPPTLTQWQPESTVVLPELTAAEEETMRTELLENARPPEAAGLPIPPPVRYVSAEENMTVQAECLREAGINVKLLPDGNGLEYEVEPGSEADRLANLHSWLCLAKYPTPLKQQRPFTREQWAVLYEYWDGFFLPCAAAHGLALGESPPSKQTWIDARMAGENGLEAPAWDPRKERYWTEEAKEKLANDDAKLAALFQQCPGWPPSRYLYP
ncbi:hypothetical protein EII12_02495 [Buchananella hordeovulneris]|uniref:hypothetical protein n=1 Tax=Buchananella hordeovulneris TaxID=52770 RepID=UPI000F5DBC86|nr:hypothetical protein [Buchananella hordeovulneris]RRD53156.1 hypothetical protein EII12_02495 [Buchananella hordeovulneris]